MQLGIMEGRLTEPKGRGIQFFPFDNWKQEFYDAKELGLDQIEFIFDFENYEENPFWTEKGISELKETINITGVKIKSVCFDYFMRRAFYKTDIQQRMDVLHENQRIIKKVINAMTLIRATLIEIPLVDDSSLKTEEEKALFRDFLKEIIEHTDESIKFGLETDLNPIDFKDYLESFNETRVGANYDSGNSSGLGYNSYEEVTTLKDKIFNIHIKDRLFHGGTVKLGTGSADFDSFFEGLKVIGYSGDFILQAARGEEGNEKENIKNQMIFVKNYIQKYNL